MARAARAMLCMISLLGVQGLQDSTGKGSRKLFPLNLFQNIFRKFKILSLQQQHDEQSEADASGDGRDDASDARDAAEQCRTKRISPEGGTDGSRHVLMNRPNTSSYNEAEARKLANLAAAAYCSQKSLEQWSCGVNCEEAQLSSSGANHDIKYIPAGTSFGATGFVALLPDDSLQGQRRCVVSFSGTSTPRHVATNLSFSMKEWPDGGNPRCEDCWIHTGFADAYGEIKEHVVKAVSELGCSISVFTGHSMGGALATVAAFDFLLHELRVDALFTYGKPRVGNPAFVKAFVQAVNAQDPPVRALRVVHYHDWVPRLPPRDFLGMNYRHEPIDEIYYTARAGNDYIVCQPVDGDENMGDQCSFGYAAGASRAKAFVRLLSSDHLWYVGVSFDYTQASSECKGWDNLGEHIWRSAWSRRYNLLKLLGL